MQKNKDKIDYIAINRVLSKTKLCDSSNIYRHDIRNALGLET